VNFADLQVFKSVVEEGGVIRAANKLHRVPSAVTTRIKQLEASMGVPVVSPRKATIAPLAGGRVAARLCRAADPAF
jgi:DNA-binding transcriptional LysR family regulator